MKNKTYFATVTATFEIEFIDDGHTVIADQAHSSAEYEIESFAEIEEITVRAGTIYSIKPEDEWLYECADCGHKCKHSELTEKEIETALEYFCPECDNDSFKVDKGEDYAN